MLFDVFRVVLRPNDVDLMARESVQPVCQVNIVKRGEEGGLEREERKSTKINLIGPGFLGSYHEEVTLYHRVNAPSREGLLLGYSTSGVID